MKKILLLLIAALTMTMASAKDIKTVVLTTVPQMHCENCEKRIKENIRLSASRKTSALRKASRKSKPTSSTRRSPSPMTPTRPPSRTSSRVLRKSNTTPARSKTANKLSPTTKKNAPTCKIVQRDGSFVPFLSHFYR